MVRSKKNYFLEEETQLLIAELSDRDGMSLGRVIEVAMESYDKQKNMEKDALNEIGSKINQMRSVISKMDETLEVVCEMQNLSAIVQGVEKFVSTNDEMSVAYEGALTHVKERKKANFIRHNHERLKKGELNE